MLPGLLRRAAVAVRVDADGETAAAGAPVGGQGHLHPGLGPQGRRHVTMQVTYTSSHGMTERLLAMTCNSH